MLRRSPTASLSRASHVEPVCKCGKELKLEQRYRDRLDRYHRQFHELERSSNFLLLLPNTKYLEERETRILSPRRKLASFRENERDWNKRGEGRSVLDPWPIRFHLVETSSSAIDPDHGIFVRVRVDWCLFESWLTGRGNPEGGGSVIHPPPPPLPTPFQSPRSKDASSKSRHLEARAPESEDFGIIIESKGETKGTSIA